MKQHEPVAIPRGVLFGNAALKTSAAFAIQLCLCVCLAVALLPGKLQADSYASQRLVGGDAHQHASSASNLSSWLNEACAPHQFGRPTSVYDAMRAGGYDWGNLSHHSHMISRLPQEQAYKLWIDPNTIPIPDTKFGGFFDLDPGGFPDFSTGLPLAAPFDPWNEAQSFSTAASTRNQPGAFIAFSGREYTTRHDNSGLANTGGHKILILPVDTDVTCGEGVVKDGLCTSEWEMYLWVAQLGGAVIQAHPAELADPHLDPATNPGGFSDALIFGMELGTTRVRWEGSYQQALSRGFRTFPAMGSDNHNRPEGCLPTAFPSTSRGTTLCWADALTRTSVIDAMRDRRCYYGRARKPELRVEACAQWDIPSASCAVAVTQMGDLLSAPGGAFHLSVEVVNDPDNADLGDPNAGMRFDTLEVVDQTGTVLRSCPIGGSTSCNCTRDDAGGLDRCTFDGLIAVASGAIYPRVSCSGKNCQQTCEDGLPGDCRWLVTGAPIYVNWNTYKTRIGFTGADDCDFDADGIACYEDNCPTDYNPDQADPDGDDVPSACLDNCPYLANADQSDVNGDGVGDACDPDADDDGQPNAADNCPIFPNPDQNDGDSDGVGDLCDNCPGIPNADQADDDSDGVGQICDNCTTIANSLFDPNTSGYLAYDFEGEPFRTTTGGQLDDDADGYGNACDGKFTAGDGNVDASDQAEFAASLFGLVMQRTCGTSGGEPCDKFDMEEASALGLAVDTSDEAAFQARNGLPPGPRCALCPLECAGDACDDDGDGLSDTYETSIGTDPGSEDSDGDGDLDLTELIAGSNPLDADSDLSPALRELAGGRVELSWSSSPGISYEVLFGAGIAQADSNGSGASLPSLESFATMVGTGASLQQIDDGSTTSGSPSDVDTRIYALQITGSHPETGSQMTVTGNPVGFVRIKLPAGGFEIIGMPFFADDDSIHVILGQQLDGASQEAEADRVLAFDALSQVYTSAFVFDSGGTAPGFDHRLFEIGGESTLRLGCGDAVFVHNRGPAQNLFLAGRLAREPHSHNLLAGMNLFAPCHAVSGRPLDATSLALAGATGGTDPIASDRVLRFVPETQAFAGQYFFDSGSDPSFDRRWFPETGGSDESFDLEAGQGYVYMNRGGPPDLVWLENVPYTLP